MAQRGEQYPGRGAFIGNSKGMVVEKPPDALRRLIKYHNEITQDAEADTVLRKQLIALNDPFNSESNNVTMPGAQPGSFVTTARSAFSYTMTTGKALVIVCSPKAAAANGKMGYTIYETNGNGTPITSAVVNFGLNFAEQVQSVDPIAAAFTIRNTTSTLNRAGSISGGIYNYSDINAANVTLGILTDRRPLGDSVVIGASCNAAVSGIWRNLKPGLFPKQLAAITSANYNSTTSQMLDSGPDDEFDVIQLTPTAYVGGALLSPAQLSAQTGFSFSNPLSGAASADVTTVSAVIHNLQGTNATPANDAVAPPLLNLASSFQTNYSVFCRAFAGNTGSVTMTQLLYDSNLASTNPIPFCVTAIEFDMVVPSAGSIIPVQNLAGEGVSTIPYMVTYTVTIYADDPSITATYTTTGEGYAIVGSRPTQVGQFGHTAGTLTDLKLKGVIRWPQGQVYAISRFTVSATIVSRPSFDTGIAANPDTGTGGTVYGGLRWDLTQATLALKCYKDTPASDDRRLMFYIDGLSSGHVIKIDAATSASIMTNSSLAALTRREKRDTMIDPAIQASFGVLAASLPVAAFEEVMDEIADITTSPMMVDALKGESAYCPKTRRVGHAAFSFGGLLRTIKQAAPMIQMAADVTSGVPVAGNILSTLATASKYADHPLATAVAERADGAM